MGADSALSNSSLRFRQDVGYSGVFRRPLRDFGGDGLPAERPIPTRRQRVERDSTAVCREATSWNSTDFRVTFGECWHAQMGEAMIVRRMVESSTGCARFGEMQRQSSREERTP